MGGRASRSKGSAAEREIAAIISERTGHDCKRTPLSGAISWLPGDVTGLPGWLIEVKRQEKMRIPEWLKQTEVACPPDMRPLLVYRRSREPWRVIIQLDDFLNLIERAKND